MFLYYGSCRSAAKLEQLDDLDSTNHIDTHLNFSSQKLIIIETYHHRSILA